MKIELKRIEYSERLSEETSAFSADLYIEGKKAGIASNRGHGGPTTYYPLNEEGRKLIADAEAFCKKLPPHTFTSGGAPHSLPMDLELFIDQILYKHLTEKDIIKFRNKADRAMEQGIIFGVPDKSFSVLKFKAPIGMLLVHPNGENVIKDIILKRILPHMAEHERILNTNIPESIYKLAGLKESQYVKPLPAEQQNQQKEQKKTVNRKGKYL